MRYQNLPLNITGGNYQSDEKTFNNQTMVNMYFKAQQTGKTPVAAVGWPGEKLYSEAPPGVCRGMYELNDVIYYLIGRNLYEVKDDQIAYYVADVPGEERVYITDDGKNLFIRLNGTAAYINNKIILQGNGLTYKYDPALPENQRLLAVNFPEMLDDEFVVSDAGVTDNFRIVNKAPANLTSDPLIQIYVFKQRVIMLGTRSIQHFQDSLAGPTPPIVPIEQASTTSVGAASKFSGCNTPDYFYFLGNDKVVYRISSYRAEPISTGAITESLERVDTSDAIGFAVQISSQWFYILQLPSADVTIAYNQNLNQWIRLSTGTDIGFSRHMIAGHAYVNNKNIIASNDDGNLYEWDKNTLTSNGNIIIRQFDFPPVNGAALGKPGRRLFTNRIAIVLETGSGNLSNANPVIMFSHSIDGGLSFSNEDWVSYGRAGEGGRLVEYFFRASFYDLIPRVRVSDPNFLGIYAASIDLKDGGK